MPYYAITTLDSDEIPLKREILYRDSRFKVWKFMEGRIHNGNFDANLSGFTITDATDEESWDWDIEEPMYRGIHAIEVPLLPAQVEMQASRYAKKLMEKKPK